MPITMNNLNMMLFPLLGSRELVERWWYSPNLFFDGKTPKDVFINDADGPEKIYAYLMASSGGEYS